jgi:hypothetical protein
MRTPQAISLVLIAVLSIGLTGCGSEAGSSSGNAESGITGSTSSSEAASPEASKPVNLTGEWEQSNKGSGSKHVATIVDDTITIYWVTTEDESKSLYWAGSIDQPEEAMAGFTWDSVNDTSKTSSALLASSDDQKTFTLDGDTINYEASALGETWTVELKQTSSTPAAAPAGQKKKTDEFGVTIEDAKFAEDYEGKPVIVVEFEFTNNSEETASFMSSINAQAFQGGIELDGWAIGVDGLDDDMAMADLKPGASVSVQQPFVLRDESTVTVEVAELFNFDNALIDSQEFSVKQ